MPQVILDDGKVVMFALPGTGGGLETMAGGTDKVTAKLSDLSDATASVLKEFTERVRSTLGSAKPTELEVELGVSVAGEGSIVFASTKVEGTISVKATWKESAEPHA